MGKRRLIKRTSLPSTQTGTAITSNDLLVAINENKDLVKLLKTKEYAHVLNQAKSAPASYANYGCYGEAADKYAVIEFYQFTNRVHLGEVLLVVIVKSFTFTTTPGKATDQLALTDITVVYDAPIAVYSFEKYEDVVSNGKLVVNNDVIDLFELSMTQEEFVLTQLMKGV